MAVHAKHGFIGEKEGNALAAWLNENERGAETRKITAIVSAVKELDTSLARDVRAAIGRAAKKSRTAGHPVTVSKIPVSREYVKILRRIDRLLADCWMRPRLESHGGKLAFAWNYRKPSAKAVHLLAQVMQLGLVDRVRTCARANCGKWFFAKFATARYHSNVCQRRDYQTGEEWKRRRRMKYAEKR